MAETPELLVPDVVAWRSWLAGHTEDAVGVFLVLAKKGVTEPTSVTYDQALDEALCQGWIDGQLRRRDESTYAQRFTPRRRRSRWSLSNVGRVQRLVEERRMLPRGQQEVDAAQADGRWEAAYAGSATAEPPADLVAAIAGSPAAQVMWDTLTRTNRYALIFRITGEGTAATRAARIARFVAMLERGETPHPQRIMGTDRREGDRT
jgi:uncharacterized protein YdeI (YjbR/CyaY-like superfamily)